MNNFDKLKSLKYITRKCMNKGYIPLVYCKELIHFNNRMDWFINYYGEYIDDSTLEIVKNLINSHNKENSIIACEILAKTKIP